MSNDSGRSIVIAAGLIVIAAGIKTAEAVMVPFLLAAFLATIAATPVFWLHRFKIPVGIAITLVMISIIGVLVGVGAIVAQAVSEFTANLGDYTKQLQALTADAIRMIQSTFDIEVSADIVLSYFDPGTALEMAGNTVSRLGSVLSNSFLILLTVIFILAEASSFPSKLTAIMKNPEEGMPHFRRFGENVNRYIAIKTSVSIVTGLVIWLFLTIVGVDFPVLWGLIAFLLNYVPTIGSIIAAVPAVLLALVQLGPIYALVTAAGYVVTNIVMGNAVEPRFLGRGLGLSTLVVFLSLVFWGWMLGPVGMLLSVPLTMTAKIALEANPATYWLAHLLGPAEEVQAQAAALSAGSVDEALAVTENP